ncbi:flagellin N-terminal helical domain-containing protein [Chitinimonas sp. BJB300]|uniref:flagellin N-terminal helical domain-containing protein n=1 Tax=Chitinimonas sp. BJB300 TaxID=1559339 RepID=UPI0026964E09|nr:flagellin [Chitinimonas sp. BJB300]
MQVINTNIPSLNAQRNLDGSKGSLETSLQRLSTGLRINSARDDAAGLAISERMTSQIRGSDQARRNANDGVSLAQVGEGALTQMGDILQRVRELAVQSANATNSAQDRQALNSEVNQLVAELDRFAVVTDFNGLKLFDGTYGSSIYQVGPNANQTITATTANLRTNNYGSYQITNMAQQAMFAITGSYTGTTFGGQIASGGSVVAGSGGASGSLAINGGNGGASLSTLTSASTARDVAAAINSSNSGVRATARNAANIQFANTTGLSYSLNVTGANSTPVNVTFQVKDARTSAGLSEAIQSFNDRASQTGITARLNDTATGIVLTNDDGSDIILQAVATTQNGAVCGTISLSTGGIGGLALAQAFTITANGSGGAAGGATATSGDVLKIGGQVTLDSDKSYSISTSSIGFQSGTIASSGTTANATSGLFLNSGTSLGSTLAAVAVLDVGSVASSTQALRIVDSALATINGQRAAFGALQNRFMATIANLQVSAENLTASRSRIRDADFAQETASLTRAQILQQAGTAMLAQANALPNQVLSLLRS